MVAALVRVRSDRNEDGAHGEGVKPSTGCSGTGVNRIKPSPGVFRLRAAATPDAQCERDGVSFANSHEDMMRRDAGVSSPRKSNVAQIPLAGIIGSGGLVE